MTDNIVATTAIAINITIFFFDKIVVVLLVGLSLLFKVRSQFLQLFAN